MQKRSGKFFLSVVLLLLFSFAAFHFISSQESGTSVLLGKAVAEPPECRACTLAKDALDNYMTVCSSSGNQQFLRTCTVCEKDKNKYENSDTLCPNGCTTVSIEDVTGKFRSYAYCIGENLGGGLPGCLACIKGQNILLQKYSSLDRRSHTYKCPCTSQCPDGKHWTINIDKCEENTQGGPLPK